MKRTLQVVNLVMFVLFAGFCSLVLALTMFVVKAAFGEGAVHLMILLYCGFAIGNAWRR